MAQNIIYADLELPASAPARLQQVSDGQETPYAELKVKPLDTKDARGHTSSVKSCGFRKHVAVLVAVLVVIILLLAMAGWFIGNNYPTGSSQQDSTTLSQTSPQDSTTLSQTSPQDSTTLSPVPEEPLGCPKHWEKHGRKCYIFNPENLRKDWNVSRKQCTDKGSDLVVIANKEELDYLLEKSRHNYYLLGLRYSQSDQKWKWINNVDHDPAIFNIRRSYQDYLCSVIGFGEVHTAHCDGGQTTQNMCEKAATIAEKLQKES